MKSTRWMKLGVALAGLALFACDDNDGASNGGGTVAPAPVSSPFVPAGAGDALAAVQAAARPITNSDRDHDALMALAASARRILLGESTHDTSEFYRERGRITQRLIRESGVNAVTIEGDWTPTFRVNLYVRGLGDARSASEALGGYEARFPRWMWRNAEFRDFVEQLRAINLTRPAEQRVGVYGMDVYNLYDAADYVVSYLQPRDTAAAARVSQLFSCFAPYERSTENYGEAMARRTDTCRDEAEAAFAEVSRVPRPADPEQAEYHLGAVRGAASVVAAEEYFRLSYAGGNAWNTRDRRMAQTVEDVAAHAASLSGQPGKTVSWSHNTHSGNAAATSVAARGELNLGQLMREQHGQAALLVGFFSYSGTVFAAPEWGEEGRVFTMLPATAGSHADLFHRTGISAFSLPIRGDAALTSSFQTPMPQRAIGVVYLPQTEAQSHYLQARLAEQFDVAVFFDRSTAVTPL